MKSNFYIRYLASLLLLFLPLLSFSQQYNFRNYSVDEGLAQSQVYAICEDNSGNMWFGTRGGGLSCFDGINFTNYTVQEGLASNFIRTITKDKIGNLWVGTDNGLSKYDGRKFTNYLAQQGLVNEVVNSVLCDSKGILWIATENGIFHLEKDTIIRFGRKSGAPMGRISTLAEDGTGAIWAGTDFGLYKFTPDNNKWETEQFTVKNGLSANIVTSIITKGNDVWICTYGGGITRKTDNSFHTITHLQGLASNTVFSCAAQNDSTLWFGNANGVTKLIHRRDSTYKLTTITQIEGLANNVVMSVFADSFGNIWFGTSGGGVSKLDSERFIHYTAIKGTLGNWVYSIAEDSAGNIWFGTSEGGVTKYDRTYYKRFSEKDGFTASKVKYIHEDHFGNLWFGTISDGLYLYSGKRFTRYTTKNGLSSNFINYILSDTLGKVWIATAGGGISYLIPSGKKGYKINHLKVNLGSNRINTLLIDKQENLWAGAANGRLLQIRIDSNNKAQVINYPNKSSSIRCSDKDSAGLLYFGTGDQGILVFYGKQLLSISKKDGLASNNIYSLLVDGQYLWAGTEKGINRITFSAPGKIAAVRYYGKTEGFSGIEAIQNAICKSNDGHIWFGNVKAATEFWPEKERIPNLPLVHITGINLFFNKIENTPFGKNLTAWYALPSNLTLPYDQNHLSFEFIGIEQSDPEAVQYQWMLEGFDKEWSPTSKRREAVYSNLPPGNYTFKVKAANELGQWNTSPAAYSFVIHPPFWGTLWFKLLAFVITITTVGLIIHFSFRRIKKQNAREREKLETERSIVELEQKALRLQMNPHFLFNCLNSIKGLIAENKQEEAKIYLAKFSKMMRAMLDNSMETFITLETEIVNLYNYVELEKLSRDNKFDFTIETSSEIDTSFTQIPPMLIQPFVENAIIHGIAPKQGKGTIKVLLASEGNYLKCVIEDNGIGRDRAEELSEKSAQKHKSAAIAVTQQRLNVLNKKLNLEEMRIIITDLRNEKKEGEGTRVELYMPYKEL